MTLGKPGHLFLGSALAAAVLAACGGGSAAGSPSPVATVASAKPAASVASTPASASVASTPASAAAKPSTATSTAPVASVSAAAAPSVSAAAASSAAPAASGSAAGSAAAKPAASGPRPSFQAAAAGQTVTGTATLKTANNAKIGGSILTDGDGWTLYTWAKDTTADKSECEGACLAAWPALSSAAAPTAPASFDHKFNLFTRSDNVKQVSMDGHPLYYFIGDKAPGDANGEGSNGFGAAWHVVKS